MSDLTNHKKFSDLREPLEAKGLDVSLVADVNFVILGVSRQGAYLGQVLWTVSGDASTFLSAWLWPEGDMTKQVNYESATDWLEAALSTMVPEESP